MDLAAIFKSHAAYLKGETEGERADFSGQDLRGRDFSGQDLREADFSKADVREASFVGCKLCDTDFSGSDARDANFSHADLTNANTSESNMMGADFTGAKVDYDNLNLGARRRHGVGDAPNDPTGFPDMWRYSFTSGTGDPIVIANVVDTALLANLSRWHLSTINISPFCNSDLPINNAIFSQLRGMNPRIKLLLYDTCCVLSQNLGPNPTSFVREAWLLATTPSDLRLYDITDGLGYPGESNLVGVFFDMGVAGPVAYANLWKKYGALGDGYWFDYFIGSVANFVITHRVNPALPAPGYASEAAMNTAFNAALLTFATEFQSERNKLMVSNSGGYSPLATSQAASPAGELLENWDTFAGYGSFDNAMARALQWQGPSPTGDGTVFTATYTGGLTQASTSFASLARYTLGSACVAGGYGYTGNSGLLNSANNDQLVWADEYTVNSAGVSDGTGTVAANRGWLGRPTAFGFKHASGCWVREFEKGIVIVNGSGGIINHPLTGTWRRIHGVFDPTINDGTTVSGTISVSNKDARFLLRA